MNPLPKNSALKQSPPDRKQHHRSSKRGGCKYPFPQRLFDLLEDIDVRKPEFLNIISWHPNGRCFQIHNRKTFEKLIQQKYFNQSKYASFRRQLNLWGFERIPDRSAEEKEFLFGGSFFHPLFQRQNRSLCCTMARLVGRNGSKKSSSAVSLRTISTQGSSDDVLPTATTTNFLNHEYDLSKNNQEENNKEKAHFQGGDIYSSALSSLSVVDNLCDLPVLEQIELQEGMMYTVQNKSNEAMLLSSREERSIEEQQQEQGATSKHHEYGPILPEEQASNCSKRTADNKEGNNFMLLINFLSANDEHISKYLFE